MKKYTILCALLIGMFLVIFEAAPQFGAAAKTCTNPLTGGPVPCPKSKNNPTPIPTAKFTPASPPATNAAPPLVPPGSGGNASGPVVPSIPTPVTPPPPPNPFLLPAILVGIIFVVVVVVLSFSFGKRKIGRSKTFVGSATGGAGSGEIGSDQFLKLDKEGKDGSDQFLKLDGMDESPKE